MAEPLPTFHAPLAQIDACTKIGAFILTYNNFELNMKLAVMSLLSLKVDTAEAVMGSYQISNKWAVFSTAFHDRVDDKSALNLVDSLKSEVDKIQTFRNDVVHGFWVQHPGGEHSVQRTLLGSSTPLSDLDHFLHRLMALELRTRYLYSITGWFVPNGFQAVVPYQPWRDKRLEELDRDLTKLGPIPTKDAGAQPKASPRSHQPRRLSSGDKRRGAMKKLEERQQLKP